jgi:hypothetical protein
MHCSMTFISEMPPCSAPTAEDPAGCQSFNRTLALATELTLEGTVSMLQAYKQDLFCVD